MSNTICAAGIQSEEDVVAARRMARDVAQSLGFDGNDQTRVATAVSEIARNAHLYGHGGKVEFLYDPPRECSRRGSAIGVPVSWTSSAF